MQIIIMTPQAEVKAICRSVVSEYLLGTAVAASSLTDTITALHSNDRCITSIVMDLQHFKFRYLRILKALLFMAYEINPHLHLYYLVPRHKEKECVTILSNIHRERPFQRQPHQCIIAARFVDVEKGLRDAISTDYDSRACIPCYHRDLSLRLSLNCTLPNCD